MEETSDITPSFPLSFLQLSSAPQGLFKASIKRQNHKLSDRQEAGPGLIRTGSSRQMAGCPYFRKQVKM